MLQLVDKRELSTANDHHQHQPSTRTETFIKRFAGSLLFYRRDYDKWTPKFLTDSTHCVQKLVFVEPFYF